MRAASPPGRHDGRPDPTRRRVVAAAATALAVPFLPPLNLASAEPDAAAKADGPTDPEARAAALLGYLEAHFAPHLRTGTMREDVRRDLTGLLRAAEALRGVDLANHEEPDFLFRPVARP